MIKINLSISDVNNGNINFILEPFVTDNDNILFRIMYYEDKSGHKEYIEQTISNKKIIGIKAQIKRLMRYTHAGILHKLIPEDIVYTNTYPSKVIKRNSKYQLYPIKGYSR